jgi:hypothetical protein
MNGPFVSSLSGNSQIQKIICLRILFSLMCSFLYAIGGRMYFCVGCTPFAITFNYCLHRPSGILRRIPCRKLRMTSTYADAGFHLLMYFRIRWIKRAKVEVIPEFQGS